MSYERSKLPLQSVGLFAWWIAVMKRWIGRVEKVWNVLLYSSAYLSIITVIEVAMVIVLLSLPVSLAPIILGLVTFAVYANDRIADVDDDEIDKPDQAAFVRRNRDTLYVLAAGSYGIAVALSVLGGPIAFALTLLPGAFWALYATDWIPEIGTRVKRLKEILVINTSVVAFAWAVSLTFLPLAYTNHGLSPEVAIVFVYFFLRSFVDTEIPNIRDRKSDKLAGVKTLPVVLGIDRTQHALYMIDLLTVGIVAYAVFVGHIPLLLAVALGVGLLYSMGVTTVVGRYSDREWITIIPEFEYVIVGIALIPIILWG